jgi:GT2 family glycosyltransferase
MDDRLPQATVVIPTRNRPTLLRACVASILAGEAVPPELVVVDQSDHIGERLEGVDRRGTRIRHLAAEGRGLARGKNDGLAAASHEIVAYLDDDMLAAPGWYGALVRGLVAAGPRAVVTGRVLATAAERPGGFAPSVVVADAPAVYAGRIATDVLAGGNMAMTKATTAEIGPFDERLGAGARFPAAEDNDFGLRVLEAGYRIVYVPEAVLYHRAWRRGRDYWKVRWSYGCGKGGFYSKHASLRDPHVLTRMVRDVGHRIVRFPWHALRHPRHASGDPFYVAGVVAGVVAWHFGRHGARARKAAAPARTE